MITGDSIRIAREVARRLGMDRNILSPAIIQRAEHDLTITEQQLLAMVRRADGFAQVVPEDKYRVVQLLQQGGHLVGMTGDGVNDAPALKKANVGIAVHGCTDAARAAAAIVLLQPGLGTIADGVTTSRAIFQRMRSYSLYRITSTIHFLLFLFIAIIVFDFTIPAVLIVLITVMNDAATLVISVDNAQISKRPDKWRIGQLIVLSMLLACMLTASSLAHYLIFSRVLHFSTAELGTILYLQMSSSPHFVIFSTRVPGVWYSQCPSPLFLAAVLGTQVIAMLFSVYGVVSAPVGWPVSAVVMGISLLFFMLLDAVKVWLYRVWSEESTLWMWPSRRRRDKVRTRREDRQKRQRLQAIVRRMRRVMHAAYFLHALRSRDGLQEIRLEQTGGAEEEEWKSEERTEAEQQHEAARKPSDDLEMVSLDDLTNCSQRVPEEEAAMV